MLGIIFEDKDLHGSGQSAFVSWDERTGAGVDESCFAPVVIFTAGM